MRTAGCLLILCTVATAQTELPQIKRQMQQHLSRLANLTCLQTIQRSTVNRTGRAQSSDTLRLEVAFVDGKELYSRLGAGKFDDRGIGDFGRGGAIESGLFATLANFVFMKEGPKYQYSGEELLRGRKAVRYNYQVPLHVSGYQMKIGIQQAVVGFFGSFWADAETLQVMRLTVHADHIPINLGLRESMQTIDYSRVRLNEADFLLPQRAEMTLTQLSGAQSKNRTEFSHWLQYVGESTLKFDDVPSSASVDTPLELPSGMTLSTHLDTEIGSGRAQVGDRIVAKVEPEARWKGALVAPAGSTLVGRIRAIEKSGSAFELALEFSELHVGGRKARFFARLMEVKSAGEVRNVEVHKAKEEGLLGTAMLQVKSDRFQLSRDLRLIWKF